VSSEQELSFLDQRVETVDESQETRKNIQLIVRIRYIVSPSVFLILTLASFAGFSRQGSFSENQLIVNGVNLVVLLVLNVIYLALSRKLKNLQPLVLFQLLIDVIHITLTIYKTGGVSSPFGFLFFFVIFEAAILKGGRSTFLVAALSAALYSLTTLLERLGWLPSQEFFSPLSGLNQSDPFIILSWAFAIASYFGFAALAGYLTSLLARRQRRLSTAYAIMTRRHETLQLLHRTSKALNSFETAAQISDAILGELLEHLTLDRALLYRVTGGELTLYMVKERSPDGEARDVYAADRDVQKAVGGLQVTIPLREDSGLTAMAAVRQEAYNVTDPENSPYINQELARRIGLNPFAVAPLVVRGRTIGVVGIDRGSANGGIQNEEFRIFQVFANQAAITLFSVEPNCDGFLPTHSV
jgi:hypothetical protein